MQCISCNTEIPPAWVHAIQSNICPGCGHAIMDDGAQTLLQELTEVMQKMPNDPVGLAGWLLSNFHLQKKGVLEPTEFYRKREMQGNQDPEVRSKKELMMDRFMKNAGVDPTKLRNKIKKPSLESFMSEINGDNEEEILQESPQEEGISLMPGKNPLMIDPKVNQPSEEELMQIAELANNSISSNRDKLSELEMASSPLLNKQRMQKLMKQQEAISGGGGFFRRADD